MFITLFSPRENANIARDCAFRIYPCFGGFLYSSAVVFLDRRVRCLVVSTPMVSFFFLTFHVDVLVMLNACAQALIDFPSLLP